MFVVPPRTLLVEAFEAVDQGNLQKIRAMIETKKVGPWINREYTPETLAHAAAKGGHLDVLKYLERIEAGLVQTQGEGPLDTLDYTTVLETAVEHDRINIVKYLVERHHHDPCREHTVWVNDAYTPVSLAIGKGHLNILKYFVEEGYVDVDTGRPPKVDAHQESFYKRCKPLLFYAISAKRHNITTYLIEERKAKLTVLDHEKRNILFGAASNGDLKLIKYVLDEKNTPIDINWKDDSGRTVVYEAVVYNEKDVLQYLVEQKKANVNIPDNAEKKTPLHYAVMRGHREICEYLVKHGADSRAKDKEGRRPIRVTSDKTLIDYMRKVVAEEVRSRRSVDYSSWIPIQRSVPSSRAHRLTGGWNVEETVSANEIRAFQFHSMLAFTNFVIQRLFPSAAHSARTEASDDLSWSADTLSNEVHRFAEDAVYTFRDFEEEDGQGE